MSHYQRLLKFIKFKKKSPREFSLEANIEYNKFNKYVNGTTKKPGIDVVIAILTTFPELNLRWWLVEEGEMLQSNAIPDDSVLVKKSEYAALGVELKGYLQDAFEAVKEVNALHKEVKLLKAEIKRLKK